MMKLPILSIVTVCYNDLIELKKTVDSVLMQNMDPEDVEYIIVDGGSTDGTDAYLAELKIRCRQACMYRYISGQDAGIYDAMNKGLRMSTGLWINFLNAGDVFHDNLVLKRMKEVLRLTDADVIYGDAVKYNRWIRQTVSPSKLENLLCDMILCHQAVFFKKDMHLNYQYDLKYKIVADYNSVLRMFLDGKKFDHKDLIVVDYNMDGFSAANIDATFQEITRVKRDHGIYPDTAKNRLLYVYGILKRKILKRLPQGIRWNIVKVKRRLVKGEALY